MYIKVQNSAQILLLELHTLDLLKKIVLYTMHSRIGVSTTSTVFKIMI